MIGKNNQYLKNKKEGTKVETYSIKKFKVGTASVVIGASIFFGAGAVAQASEEVSNNTISDNTTNPNASEGVVAAPVATAQPVAKETTKEDVASAVAAKLSGETAQEVKALDKTKLENYIAEIEAKLANGTYESKTEESVALLKADLEAAKTTLANAKTQDEIKKAYSKLVTTANTKLKAKPVEKKEAPAVDTTNGQPTVGKKAENTEKKSESNSIENTGSKDPRNGKALDKNNAFRAEIAYDIPPTGNAFGKKDSVITSGIKIKGESNKKTAEEAVNSVMKYRARYNADANGKITSVDWQVFFNNHLQNFANDYKVQNEVFRNYIQIPNEVNMPTDIRRLQYKAEFKLKNGKMQLVGGDGTGLSDTVSFDNPTPATAAGRALAKNEDLKINGNWDNYTRGLDTLYNNTSFYYKDAVKDEISDTKNLVNSNALPGKRVIYDNANTGGDYRDGYVWEFTTTVPNTVTNEQLKNMKVSMGMLSTGTAGVDHGFHRIVVNPVNLSKADVTPPTVKTQTVKVGEQPKAENSIANFKKLPAGTKAEFKTPVNTATPGEKTATAVVTYSDGSKVEKPVKVIVEKEAVAPAKPVIKTNLTGKANTKTPVEVKAEAGSTVALFDKDNNKIGEATAGNNGVASITPTKDIPAGNVTATATKNDKTSQVSDAVVATPAAVTPQPETPKPSTPAPGAATNKPAAGAATSAPEIVNDLSGKASTPADVTVKAPAGSTVKLYNTDGVVIGEAVANAQGVATVHPTNSLPAGEITATSTPAGGKESAKSTPITVTKTPLTIKDGGTLGNNNTRLYVSKTEITVYPGDKIDVDVEAKALDNTGLEKFSVEKNPTAINGVLPSGGYLGSSNGATVTKRNAKYSGTVAMDQPAGTTEVVFHAKNRDKPTTIFVALTVNVLETAKKYEPVAGTKVDVANSNGVSETEKNKIIEAVKSANPSLPAESQYSVDEKGNLTITYPDGSKDKIAAAYLVNPAAPVVAPTVEIPYSNAAKRQIYVYTGENTDLTFTGKDETTVKDLYLRGPGGVTNDNATQYGFTVGKIDNGAVTNGEGTVSADKRTATIKMTGVTTLKAPNQWTSFIEAKDSDDAKSMTGADYNASTDDAVRQQKPGYVQFVVKSQTDKYDIKTPTEKVTVADSSNVTDADLAKIKEKLQLEYKKDNDDANIAKDTPVDKDGKIKSVTKDNKGNLVVTYTDGSQDKKPLSEFVTKETTAVAPTVEIPYSNKANKEVYVYAGEENSFDIKFKDDSGKIASATVKQGGNRAFANVAGEANTINTQYGFKANVINAETPATAEAPAVITYSGTPAATDGLTKDKLEAATKGENPEGMALGWRYATATDKDGAFIENKATGSSTATDPGAFRVMLKGQTQKYDIATPTEKVVVADPANVTDADLAKIKEKLQLEYSKNNDDANFADKKGQAVADKDAKIKSIEKDADGNLVVTYKDGSQDKKPLSEFVTKKPTDADKNEPTAKPQTVDKGTTPKAEDSIRNVKDLPKGTTVAFKDPVDTATPGEKDATVVVTYPDGSKEEVPVKVTVTEPSSTPDTQAPSKPEIKTDLTDKAGTKTPVEVTAEPGAKVELFDKDGNKIGEGVADENGKATITPTKELPAGDVTAKATDPAGNVSEASTPAKATPDTQAPSKPEIKTDLTDKAGTKTPVEVTAEPGAKVELFDKDGNKIGEGVADENGKATITPTKELPAGDVTAKATDPAGNVSEASTPAKVTKDTQAPSKPEIKTDLTDKAGTKTPVEVTAEPGAKVELFDKDGNKIGEGVADEKGKATITPTVELPAGDVTAKATDPAGNVSEASTPAKATKDTQAPSKPEIKTDLTDKAGTKTPVEVTAEPGAKVELFDKDGNKIGEGVADENGKATITPTKELPAGDVTAKATDPAGNVSEASTPAKVTKDTQAPSKPEIKTDLTDKAGTKTPVEVTAEPGAKVELFDKDGNKIGEGVADENGKATITPTKELPAGDVTAKATDPAGNVSEASTPVKVTKDTQAPSKPEIKTDLTDKAGTKTPVEVTAEPGAKVELFDKDGNKIGEGVADENGKATITPTKELPAGDVTAKATDPAGNVSEASTPVKVTKDTQAPSKPEIKTDLTDKAGTKTPVEVTAEPGAKVELFDKDGNKIGEGVADENGKATITPTKELPAGDVTAKATDPAGNVSEASTPVKVTTATEVKVPEKTPVKDPSNLTDAEKEKVKEAVKKENPTATEVEVGKDGTVTVTSPDGSTVTIPGNKTVEPTTEVKVPEKTPVKDPSNLTDAEKEKVKEAVKKENPTATEVEVGKDGTVTVTSPDGSTVTIPGNKTVEPTTEVKVPEKTPVKDPSNLTDAEKEKVKEAVKKENPTATEVEVGKDGTVTVTSPDGSTVTIPGNKTVEPTTEVKVPEKTPVKDPSNLTDAEKEKVKEAVKKENPTATEVEVGKDGTVTVTSPDGSTVTIPGNKTVEPTTEVKVPEKTPVKDPSNLTDAEKEKVKEAVKKANPTAKEVEVGKDGTVTVTFPDGTKATIPGSKAVEEAPKGVKAPEKTAVKDPSNLTDAEKEKVKEAVKKANPTAKEVEVGKDGTVTVTFPDGTKATIPGSKAVEEELKGVKAPEKTPVKDPSNLTDAEKEKVKEAVKKENPSATEVEVGKDGTVTVTLPDGSTVTIPGSKAVEEELKGVKAPEKTPVKDPSNLTDAEKEKVKEAVKKANPTAKEVEVGKDGTVTVTFPDGTKATIPGSKAVEEELKGVKAPEKTPVKDPSNLTDAEKEKVKEAVKKANPTAKEVEVGKDGTVTVTFPDGTKATIPGSKAVEEAPKGVKAPEKTPVKDPSNLTDAEKEKVKEAVKKANPTAKEVEVGKDGTVTVTFPDGTKATIPGSKAVEEELKGVKAPEKTPVKDPSNLTDAEKEKVKEAVKKANPTAKEVEVGKDGTVTVTFPDGTKATIPGSKAVEEAPKGVKAPEKTPVKDPSNLTDAEKEKVKEAVKKANPTATEVEVGKDGAVTVTFPDGTKATIPGSKAVEEELKGVKAPEKTPVKDPSNLTDAEKEKVKEAVKKANPTATEVEVGKDGTVTVTFPDGTKATIPGSKAVEEAPKGVKAPEKTPVKDPSNLTDAEKEAVKEAVKKANPTATEVEVGKDGTVTVTFPDGTKATIPGSKAVEEAPKGVKAPEKTPVKDPSNLTDAEKEAAKAKIKGANADVVEVIFDKAGNATVITKDGKVYTIVAKDIFKQKEVPTLPGKVGVENVAKLTDAEKEAVKQALIAANPKLKDAKITIADSGEATIVYPDGQVVVIPANNLVTAKGSNGQGTNAKLGQRLANTGTTETNTGLAGLGLGILGGLLAAARRRKEK